MAYIPNTLTIASWASPITIVGSDSVSNLDEAVNQIVSTDPASIKNFVNAQLAKIPTYLSNEFSLIHADTISASAASALAASNSAAAALASKNAAAISESNAEADRVATAADRVVTGQDKAATTADRAQTLLDKQATAADRAQTGSDKTAAAASAGTATTQAVLATTAKDASVAAKVASEVAYAVFDQRNLGSKAIAPTLDNQGNVLIEGAEYFNSTSKRKYVWDATNLVWVLSSFVPNVISAVVGLEEALGLVVDPAAYSLGIKGQIGFGIATAKKAWYEQIGAIPLSGHNLIGHENYGNYMHGYSGAILCCVPAHYIKITGNIVEYSDVPLAGYALERSFVNGGIEIPCVFIAKYSLTKNGTIASAQRYKDPMSTASVHNPISTLAGTPANTYGGLYTAVKSMAAEAFLTPAYYYSMLARMAKAHGEAAVSTTACAFIDVLPKLPKGCNNNALRDVQDASVLYRASGYINCGLTGSAANFAKTTHNGQACGIADLNGNMWEVASGFIRYTENGFLMLKESVDIRTIMNDSITLGGGGAYDLNLYDVVDISDVVFDATTVLFGNGANQVFAMSTDRNSAAYKRTMFGIPTATGVSAAGTTEFGNDGFYRNLVNEMACLRGGSWGASSAAGVAAVTLHYVRTYSSDVVGGRASFLCL